MRNKLDLNRILLLLLLLAAVNFVHAQTKKPSYRWDRKAKTDVTSSEEQSYKSLPEVDYTPDHNIEEWSTAKELKQFAEKQTAKKIVIRTILQVNEEGVVQAVRVLGSNNTGAATALVRIVTNTKLERPSYVHNQPVTAFIPCSFLISNKTISTL